MAADRRRCEGACVRSLSVAHARSVRSFPLVTSPHGTILRLHDCLHAPTHTFSARFVARPF